MATRKEPTVVIWIIRILVAALFIFSGFVKVNDVVGFANKLDKYWYVFGMEWMLDYSVAMAFVVSVVETIVGLFLLFGILPRFTTTLLLLMIIFFTFLTGWAAITKSIDDCGCFGAAFTIPPWISFMKDVVLLALIGVVFIYKDNVVPMFKKRAIMSSLAILSMLGTIGFAYYTTRYLPVVDFRPCRVGNSFITATSFDPNTGEEPLHGYIPMENMCQENEFEGAALLVFWKKMENVSAERMQTTAGLLNSLEGDVKRFGLTNTGQAQIKKLQEEYGLDFCITEQDLDMLKTCIRSNPGFMLVKDGIILAKWPITAPPTREEVLTLMETN